MFKLYCLPGKFFARIGYLFPGKNQLWASGRRRDSRLVHFLFATPFWLLVGLFTFGTIFGSFAITGKETTGTELANNEAAQSQTSSEEPDKDSADDSATTDDAESSSDIVTEPVVPDPPKPEIVFVPGTGVEPTESLAENGETAKNVADEASE